MNTKEVLSYFTEFSPVFVEWLNDSSCNVLFSDEYTAKRAIFILGKPLPPEDIPAGQELSMDVTQLEKLWHKGPDFHKSETPIPLIFRVATVADSRPDPSTHTTRRLWQSSTKTHLSKRKQGAKQTQATRGPAALDKALSSGRANGVTKRTHRRPRGGDVEMIDAEALPERISKDGKVRGASSFLTEDTARGYSEPQSRSARQQMRRRAPKVTGLFSAAAAGILLPKQPSRQTQMDTLERSSGDVAQTSIDPPSRETVSYADL